MRQSREILENGLMERSKTSQPQSRLRTVVWATVVLSVLVIGGAFFAMGRYRHDEPRRNALAVISDLERALKSAELSKITSLVELPPVEAARSREDQSQWLAEVLRDEISVSGLAELRQRAEFGPLADIFPLEAKCWAESAHVPVQNCVAFRMERNGIRAEVVLHQTPTGFRVLRCNNVKQMASPN